MFPNPLRSLPLAKFPFVVLVAAAVVVISARLGAVQERSPGDRTSLVLRADSLKPRAGIAGAASRALTLDGMFYETAAGRILLPSALTASAPASIGGSRWTGETRMPDGRLV